MKNKDFQELWNELVPKKGEADTLNGELIRSMGRLRYEYHNNGNLNAADRPFETCSECRGDGYEEDQCYECNGTGSVDYDDGVENDPDEECGYC